MIFIIKKMVWEQYKPILINIPNLAYMQEKNLFYNDKFQN